MYAFLFDRRALILLSAGLASLGALLFSAGFLVGLHRNLPEVRAAAVLGPTLPARTSSPAQAPAAAPAPDGETQADEAVSEAAPATAATLPPEGPSPLPSPPPRPLVVVEHRQSAGPPTTPRAPAPSPRTATRAVDPPRRVARATTAGDFTVQVGAYSVADNARRRAAALAERGFAVETVERTRGDGAAFHVVRVGRFDTAAEAARAAAEITAAGGGEALIRLVEP